MSYDVDAWSYGVELEYGNCDKTQPIIDGAKWDMKDNTCVSSTGIANDPLAKAYVYGGEINTRPTMTIEEQVNHIERINLHLSPAPIVNYRSNLHIHIRVPGLENDLDALKRLLRYIAMYQEQAFSIVESIPRPNPNWPEHIYTGAMKRYKRRRKSHQYKVPESRVKEMLKASTPKEFFENHTHKKPDGTPDWYHSARAGINLRQLWDETNTIEFRHFPGTLDMYEMESAIRWCKQFLYEGLMYQRSPSAIYQSQKFTFPRFAEYDYETEEVYQWTSFGYNTRKQITTRLDALRDRLDIDDVENTQAWQVYPFMLSLQSVGV